MRKIEKLMVAAFEAGREFYQSNTHVYKKQGSIYVDLYGNTIARRDPDGALYFSCAGWYTATTCSRLRALGAPARIKNYEMIDTRTGEAFPERLTRFN